MLYFLNFQRDNRLNASSMESANGKTGEKGCIFHHTVEMNQPHPMTEPTRKGREHFSAFSLFITKRLKGITGLGCFFRFYSTPKTNCNAKTASRQMESRRRCWGGVSFERSFIAVTNFSRHRMMEVSMMAEE